MQSKVTQLWGKKMALNGRDTWVSTFWEFTLFKATRVDPWTVQGLGARTICIVENPHTTLKLALCIRGLTSTDSNNHAYVVLLLLFSHCHVQLFVTPRPAACQASLYFTISCSLLKLMSIEPVMPSNHLVFCHSLLPSVFPSIRVFSNELTGSGRQSIIHIQVAGHSANLCYSRVIYTYM